MRKYFLYYLLIILCIPLFILCGNLEEEKTSNKEETIYKKAQEKILFSSKKYGQHYSWLKEYDSSSTILTRIPLPEKFQHQKDSLLSFAAWLRNLPLKKAGTPVKLYSGEEKYRQDVHFAVIDIDCGKKDLQQCADAVMRLRAEYLFGINLKEKIQFNYTSGDKIPYTKWKQGYRPVFKSKKLNWVKNQKADESYENFKYYLSNVFNYAGSMSISKELIRVNDFNDICAGDVLIVGGFPGHAMTVMDVAINPDNGKKIFLLSQSYMPAQDIHIVKNPQNPAISPWYEIPENKTIQTPEWTFETSQLMRWKN
jgi:hypothetical protein